MTADEEAELRKLIREEVVAMLSERSCETKKLLRGATFHPEPSMPDAVPGCTCHPNHIADGDY